MRICEITTPQQDYAPLAAVAQLLKRRTEKAGSQSLISVDAFIKLAQKLGVSLDRTTLTDLMAQPPLSNIIASVDGDTIHFRGGEEAATPDDVEDNEAKVKQMAKRQLKK